jgi:nicotinamidase-related amidase
MISLDPKKTALVLIDLQKGVMSMPVAPHGAEKLVAGAKTLAEKFRAAGAPVILVRVGFAPDFADAPKQQVDEPMQAPPGGFPAGWTEIVDGLQAPGDLVVTKRQWGAFYGTDLELQLRRRGVEALVLGGVATNFGVESTLRQAWEHGFSMVVAEDLCASRSAETHAFAITHIFPRLCRIVQSADLSFTGAP